MSKIEEFKTLPQELKNLIRDYIMPGYWEHKWKMGAVSLTMQCYDDFDPDEFIPTDVRYQEQKDHTKMKKRYPTLWQQPGFITHETYMRSVLDKIDPGQFARFARAFQPIAQQVFRMVIQPGIRVHPFPHQGPLRFYPDHSHG